MSNLIGVVGADIEVSNTGGGDPLIAPGLHPAVITHIEEGTTDNGNAYIDYYFSINGGVNGGANIRSREWPLSTNEIAKDIYNKKLKSLLTICGVEGALQSLDQLCGKQLLIHNKPRARNDDPGQMQNSINYYRSYDPSAKLATATQVVAPPPVAAPLPTPQPAQPVAAPAPIPSPVAAPAPAPAPVPAPAPIPAPMPVAAPPVGGQPVQVAPIPQPAVQVAQPQPIPPPAPQPVAAPQPIATAAIPQAVNPNGVTITAQTGVVAQPLGALGDFNDPIPPVAGQAVEPPY